MRESREREGRKNGITGGLINRVGNKEEWREWRVRRRSGEEE